MKDKIGILSLGCPRNIVDSESILGRIKKKGYPIVDLPRASVAIVNTCAFIEEAKRESIDAILDLIEMKKEGRLKRIIVCGCLAQRYKDELRKELPEVDAFIGRIALNHDKRDFAITPRHYAYLKICESCINNCSYCVIPKIKGRFVSLDKDSIIDKVEAFARQGVSELNIIGQDITGWGMDLYGTKRLPEILREIVKKSGNIHWLRLLYLYPGPILNKLIDLIKDESKICQYIDLPIQHINDRILKLMRRGYTKKYIFKLIAEIRRRLPEAAIRTSLIVGFPSETDEEFRELLHFIEDARFERLGAFIYSREEGTAAYRMKNQIPEKTKLERFNAIMSKQRAISEEVNKKFLGRIMEVLIDEYEGGYYLARSQYDAPEVDGLVYVNSKEKLKVGDFVKVKIMDTLEYDLVGEVLR